MFASDCLVGREIKMSGFPFFLLNLHHCKQQNYLFLVHTNEIIHTFVPFVFIMFGCSGKQLFQEAPNFRFYNININKFPK